MARLFPLALLLGLGSSAGWSQSFVLPDSAADKTPGSRAFSLPETGPGFAGRNSGGMLAGTEVGPGATFGLGMFGLKREKSEIAPTTVREINLPKTRRAGLGLSLSF